MLISSDILFFELEFISLSSLASCIHRVFVFTVVDVIFNESMQNCCSLNVTLRNSQVISIRRLLLEIFVLDLFENLFLVGCFVSYSSL